MQDILIELFSRMKFFFKRLDMYMKVRPTEAMMDIIVKIVVEVISILGIVTKETRQGRISMPFLIDSSPKLTIYAEKYVKKLFGIRRVEDALQRLDKFTQEEACMAEVEIMMISHRIDENMVCMNDELQCAHADVQAIGREVGLINTGETILISLHSECALSITPLGVMEATVQIQLVSKHVSELNRS